MRNPFTNCSQNSLSRTTGVGPAIQMDQKAAIIGTLTLGNLECNNMASTNVCRLDSRSSVNLFTAIGLICNFTS